LVQSSSGNGNTVAIIGGVIGALIFIALLLVVVWLLIRRQRQRKQQQQQSSDAFQSQGIVLNDASSSRVDTTAPTNDEKSDHTYDRSPAIDKSDDQTSLNGTSIDQRYSNLQPSREVSGMQHQSKNKSTPSEDYELVRKLGKSLVTLFRVVLCLFFD
jgi:cytoskeletal protein RodZ